jgi:hypothetical protein
LIEDVDAVFRSFSQRHVEFVRDREERTRDRIPAVVFANKNDAQDAPERLELLREMVGDRLRIVETQAHGYNVAETVPGFLFKWLQIVRVYTKAPGEKAKLEKPYTLFAGETVGDLCRLIHQDFYEKLQLAKLWRDDAGPFTVSKDEEVLDGDIVELHI